MLGEIYGRLQQIVDQTLKKSFLMIIGNFIAKTGEESLLKIVGKSGLGRYSHTGQ